MKTISETSVLPPKKNRVVQFGLVICCLLAIFLVAAPDVWCGQHGSAQNPEKAFEKLKERLNLTDEQEEEIRPIIEQKHLKQKEIFQKYQGRSKEERQAMWGELQEVQNNTQEQLHEILSEEQIEEYKKIREEKKEHMQERSQKRMHSRQGKGMGMSNETGAATETTTEE